MNREIKFRAWDMDGKKMIYPTLHHNEKYVMQLNCSYMGEFNGKNYFPVKMPLMQYTGFKDRNGTEIYEGDILKSECSLIRVLDNTKVPNSDHVNYYVIEFNSSYEVNAWQLRTIKTTRYNDFGVGHTASSSLYTYIDKSEKIGNIYQNPELLNKQ